MAKEMGDGLFKRGKTWWIRTDPITKKQASTGQQRRELADKVYTERCRLAADPNYVPEDQASKDSVNTWVTEFVQAKRENPNRSESTADFYDKKLGHITRVFGGKVGYGVSMDIAFTTKNWDHYVKERRREGARDTTILKEIGAARTLAKFAKRRGGFRGDPSIFKPEDLDDDYEPKDRFLTCEELVKLLVALSEPCEGRSGAPHRAAHVALSIALAARYAEAFNVTPEDVDINNWTVKMNGTKTARAGDTIPISEPFRPLLALALPYLPLKPWANNNQWRTLKLACERAQIPPVTSNDLRRTHSSWLTEAGVPDSVVARVMRHVDERMVRRVYGRARPERLGGAITAVLAGGNATAEILAALQQVIATPVATATKTQHEVANTEENSAKTA